MISTYIVTVSAITNCRILFFPQGTYTYIMDRRDDTKNTKKAKLEVCIKMLTPVVSSALASIVKVIIEHRS